MKTQSTAAADKNHTPTAKKPSRFPWGIVKTGFAALCMSVLAAGIGYVYVEVINLDSNIAATTGQLRSDIDQQKQRNESIDKGIGNLQLAMRDAKEANQSIAETMGLLSDQIATLSTDLTRDIAAVAQKQKSMTTEVAALNQTNTEQSKLIETAQSQIATAREDFENITGNLNIQLADLNGDVTKHQARIESIANSFAGADQALTTANQTIADLENRYAALQAEMVSMQGSFASQQTQIEELTSGFASVRDELTLSRAAETTTIEAEATDSVTASDSAEPAPELETAPITSLTPSFDVIPSPFGTIAPTSDAPLFFAID